MYIGRGMKKNTQSSILWFLRRAANEKRRTASRKKKLLNIGMLNTITRIEPAATRVPSASMNWTQPAIKMKRSSGRQKLPFFLPPSDFSLRNNHNDVASFFANLRNAIYNSRDGHMVGIDFAALKSVSLGAGLMLAAELYRWQKFVGKKLNVVRREEWDPSVSQLLDELGLFRFLNMKNVGIVPAKAENDTQTTFLQYRSGVSVSSADCGQLLGHLSDVAGKIQARNFIYDGLVEAIKNTKHHAYTEPDTWYGVEPGTWFMSGAFDAKESTLTAAVYDHGVGIPNTLPRSSIWEHAVHIVKSFGKGDDGDMIAAAMEHGRSRTRLQERGKGLPTMMRLFDHRPGYLRVVSGAGEAIYDSETQKVHRKNHNVSIGGTLIEWKVSRQEQKI